VHKHDTATNWAKATNFIPKKGELIVYDTLDANGNVVADAVKYKFGDGKTNVNSLPFAVIDGTTSAKGIVQLTDSTSSTSTTTAATPKSVKAAYDRAGEALQDAAEVRTIAENAIENPSKAITTAYDATTNTVTFS
jgi:phage-related tail fiber protein